MSRLGRHHTESGAALYHEAMAAFNDGRHAEALDGFERALDRARSGSDPLHGLAQFYAAEAATHLGCAVVGADPEAALAFFDRACGHNPRFPDLLCWRAFAAARLGRTEASLADLEQALTIDPDHVEARLVAAVVLEARGEAVAAAHEIAWVQAYGTAARRLVPPVLRDWLCQQAPQVPGLAAALALLGQAGEADAPVPSGARGRDPGSTHA
jgi:tetratricopeptide (TPR) repeat protein